MIALKEMRGNSFKEANSLLSLWLTAIENDAKHIANFCDARVGYLTEIIKQMDKDLLAEGGDK
tara:strand:- start:207 stop:395 length:189 start_codon:yes stop_codon:yes gene_type:complete